MNFKYKLTKKVENFIKNANLSEISIGCSDSQVVRIEKNGKIYFLKIAKKGLLTQEFNALNWLNGKLSVPEIVLFDNETGISHTAARLTNNAPEKQCLFLHLRRLIPAKSREYTCFISEISYQNV